MDSSDGSLCCPAGLRVFDSCQVRRLHSCQTGSDAIGTSSKTAGGLRISPHGHRRTCPRGESQSNDHSLRYGADVRDLDGPALGNAVATLRKATRCTTDPYPDAIRAAVECLGAGDAGFGLRLRVPQSDVLATGCSVTRFDLGSVEFSARWGSPCPASGGCSLLSSMLSFPVTVTGAVTG